MESRLSTRSKTLELFDFVTFDFLEIIGSYIVGMQLESLVSKLSFVENDEVTEEKNTAIPTFEVIVHDGFIDDDLLQQRAIFDAFFSIVVKLKSFLVLFFTVHIILVSFNDWHATLTCLNDF